MRKIFSLCLALLTCFGCILFSGCEQDEKPSPYKWYGTVKQVTVGMTLEEVLEDVKLSYEGETLEMTEKGYEAMVEAGAYITWDGSSENAKRAEENGSKLNIRITWKTLYIIYIPYSFNQATASPYSGGQSHQHYFIDKDEDGECDSCHSTDANDGYHYAR